MLYATNKIILVQNLVLVEIMKNIGRLLLQIPSVPFSGINFKYS